MDVSALHLVPSWGHWGIKIVCLFLILQSQTKCSYLFSPGKCLVSSKSRIKLAIYVYSQAICRSLYIFLQKYAQEPTIGVTGLGNVWGTQRIGKVHGPVEGTSKQDVQTGSWAGFLMEFIRWLIQCTALGWIPSPSFNESLLLFSAPSLSQPLSCTNHLWILSVSGKNGFGGNVPHSWRSQVLTDWLSFP